MAQASPDIRIVRLYEAPISLVWDAWTDVEKVAQWWGPRGFSLTTHSKDFRVGGTWNYTMHGPDGVDYPNITTYLEIDPGKKLVYDHGATPTSDPLFRVKALFSEEGSNTRMEMTMSLPSAEAAQQTKEFIKKAGGNATWDRLAEFLEEGGSGRQQFVINRSFEATPEQMYQMWSDPKHFSRWLPPTGCEMEFTESEIAVGKSVFYVMTGQAEQKIYGRVSYLELTPPRRLVYTQQFCDAQGAISRHPMAPTWPETMNSTVTISDEGNGEVRVTVVWEPAVGVSTEELKAFVAARAGMTQGWTGSFDKLEELLVG